MSRWLSNQVKYPSLEAARIKCAPKRSFKDWLRVAGISPTILGAYAYVRREGRIVPVLRGLTACQWLIFEAIRARMLTEGAEGDSSTAIVQTDSNTQ